VKPHDAEDGEHDQRPDDKEDEVFHIEARQRGRFVTNKRSPPILSTARDLHVPRRKEKTRPDCAERGSVVRRD
jgi:hypothetical protein